MTVVGESGDFGFVTNLTTWTARHMPRSGQP